MTGDREKSLAAGMDDHIAKPINPEELFATLLKWIKPRAQGDDTRSPDTEASLDPDVADSAGSQIPSTGEGIEDLPPSLAGFNLEAGLKRLQGNRRLYRKLLLDFGKGYREASDNIQHALMANDLKQVHALVHNIKGLAGNLSATDLHHAAIAMDSAVKKALSAGEPGQLDSNFSALEKSLDDALVSCRTLTRPDDEISNAAKENSVGSLPSDLARRTAERLHEAADLGDINDLKSVAEELKLKSESYTVFSDKITRLAENFDFDGIIKFADELESRTETGNSEPR
jgi:HPt (histidine-containing phosphotransfer) domain-containing protein